MNISSGSGMADPQFEILRGFKLCIRIYQNYENSSLVANLESKHLGETPRGLGI